MSRDPRRSRYAFPRTRTRPSRLSSATTIKKEPTSLSLSARASAVRLRQRSGARQARPPGSSARGLRILVLPAKTPLGPYRGNSLHVRRWRSRVPCARPVRRPRSLRRCSMSGSQQTDCPQWDGRDRCRGADVQTCSPNRPSICHGQISRGALPHRGYPRRVPNVSEFPGRERRH